MTKAENNLQFVLLSFVRVSLNPVGGWVGRGWVFRGSCLLEVLSPNLQLPSHELIFPNSFYEKLNKEKLSAINYKYFSFWSGKQFW